MVALAVAMPAIQAQDGDKLTLPNGNIYEGEFRDGKPHGRCVKT